MIEKLAQEIGGTVTFSLVSICLFIVVFTGTIIWAFAKERSFLKEMESLPLFDDDRAARKEGEIHHG